MLHVTLSLLFITFLVRNILGVPSHNRHNCKVYGMYPLLRMLCLRLPVRLLSMEACKQSRVNKIIIIIKIGKIP